MIYIAAVYFPTAPPVVVRRPAVDVQDFCQQIIQQYGSGQVEIGFVSVAKGQRT